MRGKRGALAAGSPPRRGFSVRDGAIAVTESFEGEISFPDCDIVIDASASVTGSVTGKIVSILGMVSGQTRALDRIEIRKGAKQIGDIATPRISIEDGAYFKGSIEIIKAPPQRGSAGPNAIADHAFQILIDRRLAEWCATGRHPVIHGSSGVALVRQQTGLESAAGWILRIGGHTRLPLRLDTIA